MFVCTQETVARRLTPWGEEVRRRLNERGIQQVALVEKLRDLGFKRMEVPDLSDMLRGTKIRGHLPEISAINEFLGIPQELDQ